MVKFVLKTNVQTEVVKQKAL